jgi:hypothetical protein
MESNWLHEILGQWKQAERKPDLLVRGTNTKDQVSV